MGSTCCASCARVAAPAGHHAQHLPRPAVRRAQPPSSARRATSTRAPTPGRSPPPCDSRRATTLHHACRGRAAGKRPRQAPTTTQTLHELLSQREFQSSPSWRQARSVGEIAQQLSPRPTPSAPIAPASWRRLGAQRCRAGALRHPARRRRGAGDGRLTKPPQHGSQPLQSGPSLRCARIGQQHDDGIQLGVVARDAEVAGQQASVRKALHGHVAGLRRGAQQRAGLQRAQEDRPVARCSPSSRQAPGRTRASDRQGRRGGSC